MEFRRQPSEHTTLIFEKRNDNWLIVHNHTSLVQASQQPLGDTTPCGYTSKP